MKTANARSVSAPNREHDRGGITHSLRVYRAFRLLLLGTLATNTAFWMYQVAVGWLALQLLDSPLFVGITGFAGGIPLLFFALPAGVVVDRYDRRTILLSAQCGVLILAAIMAWLVASGGIAPWSVVLLVIAYGSVMSFVFPTRTTVATTLVAREDVANAIALNAAAQNATRVTGPAVAGIMIATQGIAPTFAVAALLQIFALAATFRLPAREDGFAAPATSILKDLTVGMRAVVHDATLLRVVLLAFATNVLVMPYLNLMPVFARDELHIGSSGLGLLLACVGSGTVVGALWVAHSRRLGEKPLLHAATAAAFALLVLVFALSRNVQIAVPLLFASGITSAIFLALAQTVMQLRVDDNLRGRVMSIYQLTWGLLPIGQLVVGAGADSIGTPFAVAAACLTALAFIGAVVRWTPSPVSVH
ncbi:MAG: MFS transporter [Thermomicrobiales bacterium]